MLSPVKCFDPLRFHPQIFVAVELLENPSLTSNKVNALSPVINARRLYESCMNESLIEEQGAASLLALINGKFGGWPILRSSNWDEKSFNFAELLLRINEYTTSIVFAIDTSINDRNSSVHSIRVRFPFPPLWLIDHCLLQITQGSLSLLDRTFYHADPTMINAYLDFIRNVAQELNNGQDIDPDDITQMFRLEKKIAEVSVCLAVREMTSFLLAVPLDIGGTTDRHCRHGLYNARQSLCGDQR